MAGSAGSQSNFSAFQEELGRAGAPPLVSFGPTMAGPVIYTFGTPEQKKKYLPGIIKNDDLVVPGLLGAGLPAPTSRASKRARCATATIMSSTARRSGRRWRIGPT